MNERDLERLEASLRWLQRQDNTARLSRAPQLPPVAGLPPLDPRARRHGGEPRQPLSLEPERLPPPPLRSNRDSMRWPLRILIASSVVAPVVYYFSAGGSSPSPEPAPGPQMASTERPNANPSQMTVQQLWPTRAQDEDQGSQIVPNRIRTQPERPQPQRTPPEASRLEPPQPAKPPARDTVAMLQPAPSVAPAPRAVPAPSVAPAQPVAPVPSVARAPSVAPAPVAPSAAPAPTAVPAPPATRAFRTLAPDEIALLLRQGEQFIAAGDLVTARTVFQRAAEAGDASAAVALGATYDPIMLAKLGVVGISSDVEKARAWYQKAESLGSTEARRRLEVLATR
jgi:hypothetical protein